MGRTRPSDSGCLPSAARRHAALMGLATPAAQQSMTQQSVGVGSCTATCHAQSCRCSTCAPFSTAMTIRHRHNLSAAAVAMQQHQWFATMMIPVIPGTAATAPKAPVSSITLASHSTTPSSVRFDPRPALQASQSWCTSVEAREEAPQLASLRAGTWHPAAP